MAKKNNKISCKRCATCCSYFSIPMGAPENSDDYDDLAWMLIHEDVTLHVGEEDWQIVVNNKCKYLDDTKGCLIYDERPNICRDHVPGECDANAKTGTDYDGVICVISELSELYAYRKKEKQKVA